MLPLIILMILLGAALAFRFKVFILTAVIAAACALTFVGQNLFPCNFRRSRW